MQRWRKHLWWIQPGLHLKRWLALLILGVGILSLGAGSLFRTLYPLPPYFYYLTLQFIPQPWRASLLFLMGVGSIAVSLWGLNRALLAPFLQETTRTYPEVLYSYRQRKRGPEVVILGGGHGQATILRGLKAHTANLTAIVTVADDGGSSGRLRREMGILPPGDFRNCIAALADDESLMTRVLQYRFRSNASLDGHSFGNLFISAMSGVTGSFEQALSESSRVLAVQGLVLPSTLTAVTLAADVQLADGTPVRVMGESKIPHTGGEILRVLLDPTEPPAYPGAVQAILNADLIVVGPGSLYTSIMPNLLVPEITRAIRASQAPKVYVCNVATQPGETDRYSTERHLEAIETHVGPNLFDVMITNNRLGRTELPSGASWVTLDSQNRPGLQVVQADLTSATQPWQHDSQKLAQRVMTVLA
jgi:uncharacterized cofD-like protein